MSDVDQNYDRPDDGEFEFDSGLFPSDFDPGERDAVVPGLNPTVLAWRRFAIQEAAVANEWNELARFVRWIVVRYDLDLIPECWHLHGALVEELSALKSAHDASFDATDSGVGPIGWHERFHQAQQRIKEWYRGECRGGHQPGVTRWAELSTDEWQTWTGGAWLDFIQPAIVAAPHGGATP